MDRAGFWARTDNIVLVEPASRRLLWVPRDLWCDCLRTRIASAFAMGGHAALREALAEHGLAAEHGICLAREFVERCLALADVTVPVEEPLIFRYPLTPTDQIEDGSKIVRFDPPAERLRGERIHQWLGARILVDGAATDLDRIRRQQTFVRRFLDAPMAWPPSARHGRDYDATGPAAIEELRRVESDWTLETFDDIEPAMIEGKAVLRSRQPPVGPAHLSRKTAWIIAARKVRRRILFSRPRRITMRLLRHLRDRPTP